MWSWVRVRRVTAFDRLDLARQHHMVNSLGRKTLRPLQEQAIDPILDGDDAGRCHLRPFPGGPAVPEELPEECRAVSDRPRLAPALVYLATGIP